MMSPDVVVAASLEELSERVAEYIAKLSAEAIGSRGQFTIALSGGSQPSLLSKSLLNERWINSIDWSNWHVFFADERCVPSHHHDSNQRATIDGFLRTAGVPQNQIYGIDDTLDTTASMASSYLTQLHKICGDSLQLDLVLLGMGPDGHTASLFPNHGLLHVTDPSLFVASIEDSPKQPPCRITMTLPLINKAHHVAFTTPGRSKADTLLSIIGKESTPQLSYPASLVRPQHSVVTWFIDADAASKLDNI